MWWLAAFSVSQAQPACPSPAPTAAEVVARAQSVERALVEDNGDYRRARAIESDLVRDVTCTGEPLTPYGAAVVLQVRGFTSFFAGERVDSHRFFTSARVAVPDLLLSPELAPHPAHPLARAWAEARWGEQTVPLPQPPDGVWFVNGRPAPSMPRDLPVILQVVLPDGSASWSSIVDEPPPRAEPPKLGAAPVPAPPPEATPSPVVAAPVSEPAKTKKRFPAKLVTGLVLGAAGGVLIGQAAARTQTACNLPDDNGDGFLDCPQGVQISFASGIGLASVGGGLTIWGLATELGSR